MGNSITSLNNVQNRFLIYSQFTLFFTVIVFYIVMMFTQGKNHFAVELSFFILMLQSIFCLCFIKLQKATLFRIYFFFSLIFFSLIPMLEYKAEVVYWQGLPFSNIDYVITNVFLILINSIFVIIYIISFNWYQKKLKGSVSSSDVNSKIKITALTKVLFVLISLSSLYIALYMNNYSILSLLFRGGEFKEQTETSSSISLILTYITKFLTFFCLLYGLSSFKSNKLYCMIVGIILLMVAAPTGMARFMVAAIYLPIMLIILPKLLHGSRLVGIMIFSIFIIFPYLNQFRQLGSEKEFQVIPNFDFFLEGHFDSYQSLMRVLTEEFITWGYQLSGVLLFFVPRFVWLDKPVGSGALLAENFNYSFTNIAMNFYGEGLINFGLLGGFLFAVFLAWGVAYLDTKFWVKYRGYLNSNYAFMYLFLLGYLTFLLRGDLLSSFAFLCSALISGYAVNLIFKLTTYKY